MIPSDYCTNNVCIFAENRKFTNKEGTRAEFDRNKRNAYYTKYQRLN